MDEKVSIVLPFVQPNLIYRAMGGQVLFQDALVARLNIIRPSKKDVEDFIRDHPFELTDGIAETIEAMHLKGIVVYLVSGGFRQVFALIF